MKNKTLKKYLFVILGLVCGFSFFSCSSDVTVELKKDGSVGVVFNGSFGDGLIELMKSISGGDAPLDTKQISYELAKSGFTDVKAAAKGNKSISISMTEKSQKSYLFSSGVCSVREQCLSMTLSPKTLKDFYTNCDEQIVLYLDLLLAPVFNDESMSEEEYVETLGAFYGNAAAKELENSEIKITIKNPDGKVKTTSVPVVKLLTLQEVLILN